MSLIRYSNIIYPMHRSGMSISEIHRKLSMLDSTVTYHKIRSFLRKHYSYRVTRAAPYRARKFRAVLPTIKRIIEDSYSANSSATSSLVMRRLRERNILISRSHVSRLRVKLGYRRTTTKYCHLIRDANKEKRWDFCRRMIESDEDFSQCIFSDESTIQVDCCVKYCYVKKGAFFARLRSRAKHPAKLHVWGGISVRGATALAVFPGTTRMDSEKYCQILERCYIPFCKNIYNGYGALVQDNAPAHKSAYTTERLRMWKVRLFEWPPESPDLNPIELVWGSMKAYIRKRNVRTVKDLREAASSFWKTLTPEVCERYILGIRKKMERVVQEEGRNIYEGR
ncbi:hypothetical protein OSTOST_17214 [Ostertagia ostertagi]